jgi:putative acetyltransferase
LSLVIRTESPRDYHAIAEINALAFEQHSTLAETVLIDVLRHRPSFDPDLFLVAELDGKVVGHVAFSPYQVRVDEELVPAVCLAPIAVHPDVQKEGIGGQLIEEGHRRAKGKGYHFSFLLGHPSYYPRFGYRTEMFGTSSIEIERNRVSAVAGLSVNERRVTTGDLAALHELWNKWFADCDLAVVPGNSITDWISTDKRVRGVVVEVEGEMVGYLRYDSDQPHQIRSFLATDQAATSLLLAYVNEKIQDEQVDAFHLPVHPDSTVVQEWVEVPFRRVVNTWDAAMINILDPQAHAIVAYCEEVSSGQRSAGILHWSVEFDLC